MCIGQWRIFTNRLLFLNLNKKSLSIALYVGVIIVSLITNLEWTFTEFRKLLQGRADEISVYGKQLKGIKAHLPDTGVIGYYSKHSGKKDQVKYFYLTQYELAPILVLKNTREEYLLLSYDSGFDLNRFCSENSRRVIHDSGDGIVILKKNNSVD